MKEEKRSQVTAQGTKEKLERVTSVLPTNNKKKRRSSPKQKTNLQ